MKNISTNEKGTISGTVADNKTDDPIHGVNIVVEGTSIGTSTNEDDKFMLEGIPADEQKITISHVQYGIISLNIQELN